MSKIGIMGGSFDPIHKGHTDIITYALKQLSLDSMLLIPVANNPWKEGSNATKEQRLEMLEIAISSFSNVSIDTIELDTLTKEKNYTIDTLHILKEKYPEDTLFYLMGMDQASQFDKWKDAKEISSLVQLVAFQRIGYLENENLEKYHFIKLDMIPTDISSSAVRNGHISYLDPQVLAYISNHGLYLETMLASAMSKKRFTHTKSVAHLAKNIAETNGISGEKAYTAGMFHDIAKEIPEAIARELMEKHFPMYLDKPVAIWHQWLSAFLANQKYHLEDSEILQAIRHHTTASITMTKLDMCVYVADKYDPTRGYDASKQIALCKENVVAGFKECLKDFYAFSKREGKVIDACFYEVYHQFIEEKIHE